MKLHVSPAAAAFALIVLSPAGAQRPNDTEPNDTEPRDTEVALLDPAALGVSADELETFADIFVAIEETTLEYEMQLATAASEQEARNLKSRLQRATQQKIEQRGWTQEKYDAVNETVNASPALLDRALALIDERS